MAAKMPDEARERALRMLGEHRPYREIAEACGIGLATIARLAKQAGIEAPGVEQTSAAVEATKVKWLQRKADLVDDAGTQAALALQKIAEASEGRDAKDWAVTFAVLVDKAQLLSGGVTSRHEQLDAARRAARVAELEDELAERRAARGGTTGG